MEDGQYNLDTWYINSGIVWEEGDFLETYNKYSFSLSLVVFAWRKTNMTF